MATHCGVLGLSNANLYSQSRPGRRWKHAWDQQKDARVREVYENGPRPGELARLAALFGRPKAAIQRRATTLGLSRARQRGPWTEPELWILEGHSRFNPRIIRGKLLDAGYSRTVTDIRKELRRRCYKEGDTYTAASLAEAFGVSVPSVTAWIRRGYLKAAPRGTERTPGQGDIWDITEADVREFISNHPLAFSLKKVDQAWFLQMVGASLN